MTSGAVIGVIGGSGLYEIRGLSDVKEVELSTPFGAPSDAYVTGVLSGVRMVFLPRHGRGHRIGPSEINFRANVWGLKKLGVTRIVSVSAVGSMRADIEPGDFVVIDQFFDRTRHRADTFFEGVRQLPAGHYLIVGENGVSVRRWWTLDPSRHATGFGDPKAGSAARPDYGRDMSSAHTNRP